VFALNGKPGTPMTFVFPILLELIKRFDSPEGRPQLHQALTDMESFFVRRAICELTSKNYNKLAVDLLKDLHKSGDFSATTIRAYLLRQEADVSRWPKDDEFKKGWMNLQFYKRLKKSKGRMILEALEACMHTGKTEKVWFEKKLTIEHLLPRAWEKHWPLPSGDSSSSVERETDRREQMIHKVGNLSLLTKKLNPSVSNGPWERKRSEVLKHSALNLNRALPENWDEEAIQARSEELLKVAVKVWPRP